ncbi:MAG: hypothetical protein KDF58_06655 [Alphaproteobacteria bacterium]|nr:hypothetical protein [Alphaproteobacteria bacterium]HPF45632.1 hypothetical protein [Emcibacteraceae bacterium]HRW28767.1 hypothetical protein [Emcibacteraceae bacterium]
MTKNTQGTKPEIKKDKQDRLADALRDNLKRRKAQARKITKMTSKEDK